MIDPLRHHSKSKNLYGDSLAERSAEAVANGMGTVGFIIAALTFVIVWISINGGYAFFSGAISNIGKGKPFDVAPWILLNLIFSFEAFFTGALVVIAQKSQTKKDRATAEADAKHREELHAQLKELIEANTALTKIIHDHIAK